jgi:hypothetical protein
MFFERAGPVGLDKRFRLRGAVPGDRYTYASRAVPHKPAGKMAKKGSPYAASTVRGRHVEVLHLPLAPVPGGQMTRCVADQSTVERRCEARPRCQGLLRVVRAFQVRGHPGIGGPSLDAIAGASALVAGRISRSRRASTRSPRSSHF